MLHILYAKLDFKKLPPVDLNVYARENASFYPFFWYEIIYVIYCNKGSEFKLDYSNSRIIQAY